MDPAKIIYVPVANELRKKNDRKRELVVWNNYHSKHIRRVDKKDHEINKERHSLGDLQMEQKDKKVPGWTGRKLIRPATNQLR